MSDMASGSTPAGPAPSGEEQQQQLIDQAWRTLVATVASSTWNPGLTPRPRAPVGTPGEFIPYINRAYQKGTVAYQTDDLDLRPDLPDNTNA